MPEAINFRILVSYPYEIAPLTQLKISKIFVILDFCRHFPMLRLSK